jgi:ABC-type lipoprotein release transport system permease subunit
MKNVFKLAWRNIWRNHRRSLIVISSVFFSAFFCILMMSTMDGSNSYILDTLLEQQIGHIQIMDAAYRHDKTIDNLMVVPPDEMKGWESMDNVERIVPRIETYAMAWNEIRTKGIVFLGIDPERESAFSRLNNRLVAGEFLAQEDEGVMVGKKCAEILRLQLGDTLALIGQGYHGESASGLFVVKGIIEAFEPNLDAGVAYTSLAKMRDFISLPNGVGSVSVCLKNSKYCNQAIGRFKALNENPVIEYYPWRDLIEGTMAGAVDNKKQMATYLYFLYIIVGFGLFSTVIMLINERRKEFMVMMAIGTKKSILIWSLILEMFIVSFLGLLFCIVILAPLLAYYQANPFQLTGDMADAMVQIGAEPVLPMGLSVNLFITQISIVFAMIMAVCLYPIVVISKNKINHSLE